MVVRRFDRDPVAGFVNPHSYLQPSGVEVLTPEGTVALLSFREVKTVCFVRDFSDAESPSAARVFNTRPKMDGLWVRMTLRDSEMLDGILSNDLLAIEPYGFTVTPPEPYSNNQKLFVPREALRSMVVLGVVGSPLTRGTQKKPPVKEQPGLFD